MAGGSVHGVDSALGDGRGQVARPVARLLTLFSIIAVALALVHFGPLHWLVDDVERIKSLVRRSGVWSPLIALLLVATLVAVGVPRLPLCGLTAAMFGFSGGLIISQFGTLTGAYACFLVGRWLLNRASPGRSRPTHGLQPRTALDVFILRQTPAGGVVINLILALSRIHHCPFLIGSFLGFLPQALVVSLMASGLTKSSTSRALLQVFLALVCILAICMLIRRLRRSRSEVFGAVVVAADASSVSSGDEITSAAQYQVQPVAERGSEA